MKPLRKPQRSLNNEVLNMKIPTQLKYEATQIAYSQNKSLAQYVRELIEKDVNK
jgi:predicted HicB family RNase H-like nuclease